MNHIDNIGLGPDLTADIMTLNVQFRNIVTKHVQHIQLVIQMSCYSYRPSEQCV